MTPRQIHGARKIVLEDTDNPPPLTRDLLNMYGRAPRPPVDDGTRDDLEQAAEDEPPDDVDARTDLAVRLASVARALGWQPAGLHEHLGVPGSPAPTLVGVVLDAFDHDEGPVCVYRNITSFLDDGG